MCQCSLTPITIEIIAIWRRSSEICSYPLIAIDVNVIRETASLISSNIYKRRARTESQKWRCSLILIAIDVNVTHPPPTGLRVCIYCRLQSTHCSSNVFESVIWSLRTIVTDIDKICVVETLIDSPNWSVALTK